MSGISSNQSSLKRKASATAKSGSKKKRPNPKSRRVTHLLEEVARLSKYLEAVTRDIPTISTLEVHIVQIAIEAIADERYDPLFEASLKVRLTVPEAAPVDKINSYNLLISEINASIDVVLARYRLVLELTLARPSPSDYAQPSTWEEWQLDSEAILCLRPTDKQGLPLSTLHDVFRRFQLQVDKQLPQTKEVAPFLEAAFSLCGVMGDKFDTEKDRTNAFNRCVQALFSWSEEHTIATPSEKHWARIDACVIMNDRMIVIREDKIDIGEGHDAYMQASRGFQIYVSSLRDKESPLLDYGAPTFVVTLQGPQLLVCGGFYDGKSCIVEPLAHPCLMLSDFSLRRQEDVARQLFALKEGVNSLCGPSSNNPLPPFVAKTPRLYQSFTARDGQEVGLVFVGPNEERPTHMFRAKASGIVPDVLVKLVNGRYGGGVHELLAQHGLAPKLHGMKHLDGAPTAIVMEFLEPLSATHGSPGWLTLHEFKKRQKPEQCRETIKNAVQNLLQTLEKGNMVHGDLRSNNIMVEVDSAGKPVTDCGDKARLKVVDFDWGGRAGEVHYPMLRNDKISWPATRLEPIHAKHDRKQVSMMLEDVFPPH